MQAKEEGVGQAVHSQTLEHEKEAEQKEWTNSVYILFPNANDLGTHDNISGWRRMRRTKTTRVS